MPPPDDRLVPLAPDLAEIGLREETRVPLGPREPDSPVRLSPAGAANDEGRVQEPARPAPAPAQPAPPPAVPPASSLPVSPDPAGLSMEALARLATRRGLVDFLKDQALGHRGVLRSMAYRAELRRLQVELVKLQRTVQLSGRRIAVLFEGRDAAGKGGAIRRFIQHLNPRTARVVALPKPTEVERGQWYFQRYVNALPNPGEICFFDRSWYNRAVVEPVMGFCTQDQYAQFLKQVPSFEHMLYEDGIELIKFWFSISKREQAKRFESRKANPLKQWKISPVDEQAQERWSLYTRYKEAMFSATHTPYSPWVIVRGDNKRKARLESMRYVLHTLPYDGKEDPRTSIHPDPRVVRVYHRARPAER